MKLSLEQRANIKFCCNLGKNFTETYQLLQQAYGEKCLCRTQIYEWFNRFQSGRENISDGEKSGRPKTAITQHNIDKVHNFIRVNRNASLRFAQTELGLSKETIRRILTELGLRKLNSVYVPHKLNDEIKLQRLQYSKDIINYAKIDANFLYTLVTGGATCCEPETNHKSAEAAACSDSSKKIRLQRDPNAKSVLICFYDGRGIIYKEFVTATQSGTAEFCLDVLKRVIVCIRRLRPEYEDNTKWRLVLGAHRSLAVTDYLTENGIFTLKQPLCSPDLAGCEYFLFPKLHIALRGKNFNEVATTDLLDNITQIELRKSFEMFLDRANLCVAAEGDYFQ